MRIVIADDDPTMSLTLGGCLTQLGHEVSIAENGREALAIVRHGDHRVLITDWEMPEMDGLELCRQLRGRRLAAYVYVILLTSRGGQQNLIEGLSAGADDFITKPFQPDEIRARLRAAERIVGLESRDLVIFALARLAESRDNDTGTHLERIREYSRVLAADLAEVGPYRGEIDDDFVHTVYLTSPLHDIGKVGISDHILLKPGKLSESEFELMKQHVDIGRRTLDDALASHPHAEFLRIARDIAWTHHERFDGRGYPRGLRGYEIPLCGRIVAVADVYDALTSQRAYKPAYSHEVAREEILSGSGTAFDPAIVDAFLRKEQQVVSIRRELHAEAPQDSGETLAGAPLQFASSRPCVTRLSEPIPSPVA